MDRVEALANFAAARVAHLATVRPDRRPHVVPITFTLVGGNIVTAVDHKPKSTRDLQRLENIKTNRTVSVLVDQYNEDWERLWWVRIDGPASIHDEGELYTEGIAALVAKYPQYQVKAPDGPMIVISQDRVVSWESSS